LRPSRQFAAEATLSLLCAHPGKTIVAVTANIVTVFARQHRRPDLTDSCRWWTTGTGRNPSDRWL